MTKELFSTFCVQFTYHAFSTMLGIIAIGYIKGTSVDETNLNKGGLKTKKKRGNDLMNIKS